MLILKKAREKMAHQRSILSDEECTAAARAVGTALPRAGEVAGVSLKAAEAQLLLSDQALCLQLRALFLVSLSVSRLLLA